MVGRNLCEFAFTKRMGSTIHYAKKKRKQRSKKRKLVI